MANHDSDDAITDSQRFVPQEDDDETLWEVVEITGERAKQYKVKWKGVDPKTNKPWQQSWVPKYDCTDDLVMEWKKKERRKSAAGASKRASVASGSKSTRRSTSTVAQNLPKKRTRSSTSRADAVDEEPEAKKPTKRRTRSSGANLPVESEDEVPKSPTKKQKGKARPEPDSSEDEQERRHATKPKPSGQSKPKGKKRKHEEATSAHNSAKNISGGDATNGRKKRKITVEVVKQEPESEELMDLEPEDNAEEDEAEEDLISRELSQLEVEVEEEEEEEVVPKSPKKRKAFIVQSRSASYVPPPPQSKHRMPTEERSVFWDGDKGAHQPILSPNAQLQLEEFDEFMAAADDDEQQPVASSSKVQLPSTKAYDGDEVVPETDESQEILQIDAQSKRVWKQKLALLESSPPLPPTNAKGKGKGKAPEKEKERERNKPLRPIPQLSPSVFHPHLPKPPQPPQSSLPESIANASDESGLLKLPMRGPPRSPIEQFDSPARVPLPTRRSVDRNGGWSGVSVGVGMNSKGKGKASELELEVVPEIAEPSKAGSKSAPKATATATSTSTREVQRLRARESATDIWESEVVQRGQQLAEEAKQRRRMTESSVGSPPGKQRRTVEEIIKATRSGKADKESEAVAAAVAAATAAAGAATGAGVESAPEYEDEDEYEYEDEDEDEDEPEPQGDGVYHPDALGTSTLALPSASEPPHLLTLPDGYELDDGDDPLTLAEMEFAYVDLSGGVAEPSAQAQSQSQNQNEVELELENEPEVEPELEVIQTQTQTQTQSQVSVDVDIDGPPLPVDPTMLRQEEEESTQDIVMQFQVTRPSPPPVPPLEPVMEEDGPAPPATKRYAATVEDVDEDESDSSSQQLHVPQITIHPASRGASVLSNADEEPQAARRVTRSRSRSQTPALPTRTTRKDSVPPTKRGGSVAPIQPLPPVEESTELADAKSLIASLQAELASVRDKNATLEASLATLRPQIASLNKSLHDKHEWATREIGEAETNFATQKDELEAALRDAESAKAAAEAKRVDAEKDRDFFREQYAQASGFVSQVRDENKDLLKRIAIAEGQAETGVALVRATFEERVRTLDADLKSWRRMAEFLMEKDRRSNNAEICRRAAEAPELRARCEEQARKIDAFKDKMERLREKVEERDIMLQSAGIEMQTYKDQVVQLNEELDVLTQKLELAGIIAPSQDTSGSAGNDMVYRCEYRPGNQMRQCQEVFSTREELKQHVIGPGGHIEP